MGFLRGHQLYFDPQVRSPVAREEGWAVWGKTPRAPILQALSKNPFTCPWFC